MYGIIPKDLRSEILKSKDLIDKGFREIEAWCRKRVLVLQNEHLAEIAKKSLTHQVTRKLKSLKPDAEVEEPREEEEALTWVKHRAVPQPNLHQGHRQARDRQNQIVARDAQKLKEKKENRQGQEGISVGCWPKHRRG